MIIGYARVSSKDQNLQLQIDALNEQGCEQIFKEKMTGSIKERPKLIELLYQLRKGDVVVVWKLDRLGRSIKDLISLVNEIQEKGAEIKSIKDNIDTNTASGKLTFHLFAALSEFERDIIRERTFAGLKAARARGKVGGRKKGLSQKAEQTAIIASQLYIEEVLSIREICEQLSISKPTLYRYLRHRNVPINGEK